LLKKYSFPWSPGLFALDHLKYMTDRQEGDLEEQPTLSEMAAAAVRRLRKSKKGFFLLVEGGRIDHAHHDNFAHRAFEETREMEKTVRVRRKRLKNY
jgi:alkaline phosphatase